MTEEGAPTLSPIFLPYGPPLLKRLRSSTVFIFQGMEESLQKGVSYKSFFMDLYQRLSKEHQMDDPISHMQGQIIITIIITIYNDYKAVVDTFDGKY